MIVLIAGQSCGLPVARGPEHSKLASARPGTNAFVGFFLASKTKPAMPAFEASSREKPQSRLEDSQI